MKNKPKHLEMIQAVINRMAGNLFYLKGWAVTLIAGILALSANYSNPHYALLSLLLVFVFWLLDGYFLSQERLFRDLYSAVCDLKEKEIDFSMNVEKYKVYFKNTWIGALVSPTLFIFYGALVSVMLISSLLLTGSERRGQVFGRCGDQRTFHEESGNVNLGQKKFTTRDGNEYIIERKK